MADEIQITMGLAVTNGNFKSSVASATEKITQTTLAAYEALVFVGTSEEDLATGDVTASNGAWLWIKNLDSTNFVKYGPKSGTMVEFGRLYAGKSAWVFLAPSVVLRWIADTAQCKVQVKMFEK